MIYLDYAANTPAQKNVLECFCRIENEYIGNPNSVHPAGIREVCAVHRRMQRTRRGGL